MSDEKPTWTILMTPEDVIKMLKKDDPEEQLTNECMKTLDTIGFDTIKGRKFVVFQGEQYPIVDGKVIKEDQ